MKRTIVLTMGLAALAAVPVQAQLTNFPVYALPTGAPATYLGATYGRGLNDASGELDSYGAFVARSGVGGRASLFGGLGLVNLSDPLDDELTYGGGVAVDLLAPGGSAQVALQGGVGYFSVSDVSNWHFPIGVALKGNIEGPSANVVPFVMPRLSINSPSEGDTSTDFGVSGGVAFTTPGGFGAHTAIDLLASDEEAWLIGVGVHYMIP